MALLGGEMRLNGEMEVCTLCTLSAPSAPSANASAPAVALFLHLYTLRSPLCPETMLCPCPVPRTLPLHPTSCSCPLPAKLA